MKASAILAFSTRAAAVGGDLWPGLVLIAGQVLQATVPEPRPLDQLGDGGELVVGELVVRIAITELPTAPAEQQALRWKRPDEADWRPEKWWISQVKKAALDVEWLITCSPKN